MKLEEGRSAGVVSPFLKTRVPVWPGGINDGSAEIESQGVRGRSAEPASDEVVE